MIITLEPCPRSVSIIGLTISIPSKIISLVYVTAVDSFGNIETVETTVKISTDRPVINSIDVDKETGTLLINAADQDGLQTIEVNLNGAVYRMDDVNRTDFLPAFPG